MSSKSVRTEAISSQSSSSFEHDHDERALRFALLNESYHKKKPSQLRRLLQWPWIISAVCILTTTISLAVHLNSAGYKCREQRQNLVYNPASEAVAYEAVTFTNNLDGQSVFVGEPRQELHDAWNKILKNGNTRVTAADLDKINRTSIPLQDEKGGYLASLDVYHELHCLNEIRKQVYREYYPDKHDHRTQFQHVDHCIDLLRQVIMCHGDMSLGTFGWINDYRWPWPNFTIQHECRRWDLLDNWAEQHAIPISEMYGSILTHPELGPSYRLEDMNEGI